ncbi:hypothetical protein ACS0TY_008925 [Phlomoides rotata]
MMKKIVLRPNSSAVVRRQPLLENSDYSSMHSVSMAEVAGGTTADYAVVCCYCPCGLVNHFVLAVYKVPTGLFWKALRRKHHRRLMKKGGLPPRRCGCDEEFFKLYPVASHTSMVSALESLPEDQEVIELEKEMWDKFYGAGFWRSPSQRRRMDLDSNPDKINPLVFFKHMLYDEKTNYNSEIFYAEQRDRANDKVLEMESLFVSPDCCREDLASLLRSVQVQEKEKLYLTVTIQVLKKAGRPSQRLVSHENCRFRQSTSH